MLDKIRPAAIWVLFWALTGAGGELYCEIGDAASVRALRIKDAIDIAIMNNRSVQIQEEEIEYAKAGIGNARSRFLPVLSAAYAYTYNDAIPALPTQARTRKDPHIFYGYENDNAVSFNLNESFFNGGADYAGLKQAELELKIEKEALRSAKLDIEFETKRLFYGLLLAYETRRIAQDLVGQAKAHYLESEARFGQGSASRFDVLQSKVQVSRLTPQLVNAENAIDLIMAEFKKLLALKMAEEIKIEGELSYEPVEIKEEEFLREAYKNKPEMKMKLLGMDVDRWGIESARSGWMPQVSASANYNYRSNDISDMMNPRHDQWNVGIKASIALFDGFATKAKVDEAKARYNQSKLRKEDLIDQIALDIRDACLGLRQARAVIDSQTDSVGEAKEVLRLSEVRYDNGVGINLDVLDAQVALAQVEQILAQAIYDYIMANAQLDRTMGRQFFAEGNHAKGR